MTMKPENSLLLQCLATTSFLAELSNARFLESEYFERLYLNPMYKVILKESTLGNPATMQSMLYILLVIPREALSNTTFRTKYAGKINQKARELIEEGTFSTYKDEDSPDKIDYFRHIRNAVTHARCTYFSEQGKNYVVFSDNNGNEECSIKMECYKVGELLMELQRIILEYLKSDLENGMTQDA